MFRNHKNTHRQNVKLRDSRKPASNVRLLLRVVLVFLQLLVLIAQHDPHEDQSYIGTRVEAHS